MTANPIAVADVAIRTAVVEVKCLTLSGKQMTLAVFRQLPERDYLELITDAEGQTSFRPLGTAWGWVNYHPNADCWEIESLSLTNYDHIHVVFEVVGCLFRGVLQESATAGGWAYGDPELVDPVRRFAEWKAEFHRVKDELGQLFIAV